MMTLSCFLSQCTYPHHVLIDPKDIVENVLTREMGRLCYARLTLHSLPEIQPIQQYTTRLLPIRDQVIAIRTPPP